jgi:hypothetical protein
MTVKEFKVAYPQYSNLEGDDLWDKMTEVFLECGEVLYADPNQVKVFHEPIQTEYGKITIEDSSTTRWLNSKGELVRVGEPDEPVCEKPVENYKFEIIDFGEL